jgi:hypothetical protein
MTKNCYETPRIHQEYSNKPIHLTQTNPRHQKSKKISSFISPRLQKTQESLYQYSPVNQSKTHPKHSYLIQQDLSSNELAFKKL